MRERKREEAAKKLAAKKYSNLHLLQSLYGHEFIMSETKCRAGSRAARRKQGWNMVRHAE